MQGRNDRTSAAFFHNGGGHAEASQTPFFAGKGTYVPPSCTDMKAEAWRQEAGSNGGRSEQDLRLTKTRRRRSGKGQGIENEKRDPGREP